MILISGSTSQIGKKIINGYENNEIICLKRTVDQQSKNIYYNISEKKFDRQKLELLSKKIKIFINIAYSRTSINNKNNLLIIQELLKCLDKNTVLINISTISAYTNSNYGMDKKDIEIEFEKYNGHNIRCGLIYDTNVEGFLGKLIKIVEKFKIIILPKLFKNKIFYLTDLYDLSNKVHEIINLKGNNKRIQLLDKEKYSFYEILKKFCQKRFYCFYVSDKLFLKFLKISTFLKLIDIGEDSFTSIKDLKNKNLENSNTF